MKKTIQINLAGSIFHIDDDAYERLREYLTAVEHRFAATPDGREIIHDLELRMSYWKFWESHMKWVEKSRKILHGNLLPIQADDATGECTAIRMINPSEESPADWPIILIPILC